MLCFNLYNISFTRQASLSRDSVNQRLITKPIKNYRGCIYDRDMIPFVDKYSTLFSIDNENAVNINFRYNEKTPAKHIIGYTFSDGSGASGLEKAYDSYLSDEKTYDLTYIGDAKGNPVKGKITEKENSNYISDKNLKTTLNYKIQKIAEQMCDKYIKNGAIVILDVDTFDVLASVSRPEYNQNDVVSSFNLSGSPLLNKAFSSYNAGSIFKIITTASYLENGGDANFLNNCTGMSHIDGKDFSCNNPLGHKALDLKNAFAKSCNCYFYTLGINSYKNRICEMAKKFGMGNRLLNYDTEESKGFVPDIYSDKKREIANISIGQGELLITPLQAAYMCAVIANNGIGKSVNLADSIVDEEGKTIKNLRNNNVKKIISKTTAVKIQEMMLETTLSGTGKDASNPCVTIAGKTGSAETGWVTDGENYTHGWFCGFFPYDTPKYAMAVFCENGKSGSTSCIPPFREIAIKICEISK